MSSHALHSIETKSFRKSLPFFCVTFIFCEAQRLYLHFKRQFNKMTTKSAIKDKIIYLRYCYSYSCTNLFKLTCFHCGKHLQKSGNLAMKFKKQYFFLNLFMILYKVFLRKQYAIFYVYLFYDLIASCIMRNFNINCTIVTLPTDRNVW